MKLKNVKKQAKATIVKGMRYYFELRIPYHRLGLDRNKFISDNEIIKILGLEKNSNESGFVDHFKYFDYNTMLGDIPLTVNLGINCEYSEDMIQREWNKDKYFHEHDGKFYYISGSAGFQNPDWNYESPRDAPYWLNDENGECSQYKWEITKENVTDKHKEVLRKYANNKEFGYDMLGDCSYTYDFEKGKLIELNKYNDLCVHLSRLSKWNKTNYYTFTETHVHICYGIRYSDYVEPFIKDFKKLVKKFKLKNWQVK